MEALEKLSKRIEYGRKVENESSKIFFSLEPTLRFALINFLTRKYPEDIVGKPLYHMSDLEVINLFDEVVILDDRTTNLIYELYHAITSYRLIAFSRAHQTTGNGGAFKARIQKLKNIDYYFHIMDEVISKLLSQV